jgi:hypothetical protein
MRLFFTISLLILCLNCSASAGLLSGSASDFVDKAGEIVVGVGVSTIMFETPFSTANLSAKYGITDDLSVFGKVGAGSVDYTVTSSFESTAGASIVSAGIEYNFLNMSGIDYNIVAEFETAYWGVNDLDNRSSCTELGVEMIRKVDGRRRIKIRLAAFLFDAGANAGPKITSTTKYGVMTENEYDFIDMLGGYFEGGILGGDPEGILFYFGGGFNFNFFA